jgi:hypothetical protein
VSVPAVVAKVKQIIAERLDASESKVTAVIAGDR